MHREFKVAIYPSLRPRSNINYSISLKNGYIKSKQSLIDELKHSPSIQSPTILKKFPAPPRKKRTISVIDFSDILKEKLLKLPSINNTIETVKYQESSLIKDGQGIPPTKSQKSRFLKIPPDITHILQLKLDEQMERSKSNNNRKVKRDKQRMKRKSISVIPAPSKKKAEEAKVFDEEKTIELTRNKSLSITKKQKRLFTRKAATKNQTNQKSTDQKVFAIQNRVNQFDIQPWEINHQLKFTMSHFYTNYEQQDTREVNKIIY